MTGAGALECFAPHGARLCPDHELARLALAWRHLWNALEQLVRVGALDDTVAARLVVARFASMLEVRLRVVGPRASAQELDGLPLASRVRESALARWDELHRNYKRRP